jgi:hypothetical protein
MNRVEDERRLSNEGRETDAPALAGIDAAQTRLERERRELTAEARAFGSFADHVRETNPVQPTGGASRTTLVERPRTDDISHLREVYRETVMAVDHYDRVYGESLPGNVAAELGPDVADVFRPSVDVTFAPQFKRALLAAAETAREERTALLTTLEEERASLRDGRRKLASVADAVGSEPIDDREALLERIDAVAADRQRLLHSLSLPSRINAHDLCEYLYDDLDAAYPVLSAVTTLRDRLE